MAEKKNEVAKTQKQELTMSGYFTSELDRISGALPVDFNKQRFALNFVSLIQDKPELQKYSKEVLATALVRSAQDNLDALNNEVYIYKGYNDKLTYTPSYKGLRKMAIEKSVRPIKDIYAKTYNSPIVSYCGEIGEEGFICANALSGKDCMNIYVQGNEDRILLISRFDNLGKGASGAAVECMNIMLGIDEKTGLDL